MQPPSDHAMKVQKINRPSNFGISRPKNTNPRGTHGCKTPNWSATLNRNGLQARFGLTLQNLCGPKGMFGLMSPMLTVVGKRNEQRSSPGTWFTDRDEPYPSDRTGSPRGYEQTLVVADLDDRYLRRRLALGPTSTAARTRAPAYVPITTYLINQQFQGMN
ncbi:hypothetical protein BC826DRAFT_969939 [Russula brevipes]|nr:hypothetical protein BC826DRAFT_969939 [Russula brevipes]